MRYFLSILLVLWVLSSAVIHLKAQNNHRWEVGTGIGVVGCLGDLNKRNLLSDAFRPSLNIFARKYLSDKLSLRYNFQVGQLSGRDSRYADRKSRNLTLSSNFIENTLLVEWDLKNINPRMYKRQYGAQVIFSPYICSGIALLHNNPKPTFDQTQTPYAWIREGIETDRLAQYSRTHIAVPFGIGVKIDISPEWVAGIEGTFRMATGDYLDGVSHAGNPNRNDAYQTLHVHLTRRLGLAKMKVRRIRRRW